MIKTTAVLLATAVVAVLGQITSCQSVPSTVEPSDPVLAESAKLFQGHVRKVIEHRCIHCHHDYAPNGGLNFQDRELVFRGDSKGPYVVPGKPNQSRIWDAIFPPMVHPKIMPGDGWGMNAREHAAFLKWIKTGAYWPEGKAGKLKIRNYEVEIDGYL